MEKDLGIALNILIESGKRPFMLTEIGQYYNIVVDQVLLYHPFNLFFFCNQNSLKNGFCIPSQQTVTFKHEC